MPGPGQNQPIGVPQMQPGASDQQIGAVNLNQGIGANIPVGYSPYAIPGPVGPQYQYSPNQQIFGAQNQIQN